jgi:hypothetical protein
MFEKIPIASRFALDDGLLIDVFRRGEAALPPPQASFLIFRRPCDATREPFWVVREPCRTIHQPC